MLLDEAAQNPCAVPKECWNQKQTQNARRDAQGVAGGYLTSFRMSRSTWAHTVGSDPIFVWELATIRSSQ